MPRLKQKSPRYRMQLHRRQISYLLEVTIKYYVNYVSIGLCIAIYIIKYNVRCGSICALEPWYACAYREFLWAGGCCALLAHIRWLTTLSWVCANMEVLATDCLHKCSLARLAWLHPCRNLHLSESGSRPQVAKRHLAVHRSGALLQCLGCRLWCSPHRSGS